MVKGPPTRFPNGIIAPILPASGTQTPAVVALTDSSGGTASNTVAAIAAGAAYTQADAVAMKNAIASLTAKVNALNAALQAAGITAS